MTDQEPLEPLMPGATPGTQTGWAAGWYPDPWTPGGQHRYWDGRVWTVHTAAPPAGDAGTSPPAPPTWTPPSWASPTPPTPPTPPPAAPRAWTPPVWASDAPPARPPATSSFPWVAVLGVVVACVLVASVVAVVVHHNSTGRSSTGSPPATLVPGGGSNTTLPPVSGDPDARVLPTLGISKSDVPSTYVLGLIEQGNRVPGTVTLDLCNGAYTSEAQRTARYQVALAAPTGTVVLSTESVLYEDANSTALAFTELRARAAACPKTFVPAPPGEAGAPPTKTTFAAPPDASWSQTPTVQRLAYAFTSTDPQGNTVDSIAVYLRRGRVLMGIYFNHPTGAQGPIAGRTSIADIVSLLAGRLADLPSRVVTARVPAAAGGPSAA